MADRERLDVVNIVMAKLRDEFAAVIAADPETYKGYGFVLSNEQQYVREKEKAHKTFYIIVKFLQGSYDFGQQKQPISITAVSEHNGLAVCQQLMFDFAEVYNLKFETDQSNYTLRQIFSTATAQSNFNEVFEGFRSVFYISGSFYFGINSNPITAISVDGEDIDFISSQLTYQGQPDGQPFYGTNNFNKSVIKIGTLSVGFTMYAVNTDFYNNAMKLVFNGGDFKDYETYITDPQVDVNKEFTLNITLKSGGTYVCKMRLANVSFVQEVRDFPSVSFTFVR